MYYNQQCTHGVEVFNAGVLEALGDLASGDNCSHRVTIPHGLPCHRTPLDTTWFVGDGKKERETEVCVLVRFEIGVIWSNVCFVKSFGSYLTLVRMKLKSNVDLFVLPNYVIN